MHLPFEYWPPANLIKFNAKILDDDDDDDDVDDDEEEEKEEEEEDMSIDDDDSCDFHGDNHCFLSQ